jgi:hypothetical protein
VDTLSPSPTPTRLTRSTAPRSGRRPDFLLGELLGFGANFRNDVLIIVLWDAQVRARIAAERAHARVGA